MNRLPPVSSLMSPPEAKPFDSFNPTLSPCASQPSSFSQENILPPISADRKRTQSEMDLPSPPVTPYVGHKKRKSDSDDPVVHDVAVNSNRDPVLFPRNEVGSCILPDEPLFGPELAPAAEALIEKHMATQMTRFQGKVN